MEQDDAQPDPRIQSFKLYEGAKATMVYQQEESGIEGGVADEFDNHNYSLPLAGFYSARSFGISNNNNARGDNRHKKEHTSDFESQTNYVNPPGRKQIGLQSYRNLKKETSSVHSFETLLHIMGVLLNQCNGKVYSDQRDGITLHTTTSIIDRCEVSAFRLVGNHEKGNFNLAVGFCHLNECGSLLIGSRKGDACA